MKNKKSNGKFNEIKSIIKDFLISSSFQNSTKDGHIIPRLIWSLIWLISASYCSFSICNSINTYFKYEVITNAASHFQLPKTFPAVTVCFDDKIEDILISCILNNDVCDSSSFVKIPSTEIYHQDCYTINKDKLSNGSFTKVAKVFNLYPLEMVFMFETNYLVGGLRVMIHNNSLYPTEDSIITIPTGKLYNLNFMIKLNLMI